MFKFRPHLDLMIVTFTHDPEVFTSENPPTLDVPMQFKDGRIIMKFGKGKTITLRKGEQVTIYRYVRDTRYQNCIATKTHDQFGDWLKPRMHKDSVGGVTYYTTRPEDNVHKLNIFGVALSGGQNGRKYSLNNEMAVIETLEAAVKITTEVLPIGNRTVPRGKRVLVYCTNTKELMLAADWLIARFCGQIPTALTGTVEFVQQPLFNGLDAECTMLPDQYVRLVFHGGKMAELTIPSKLVRQYFKPVLNSNIYTFKQFGLTSSIGKRTASPRIFGFTVVIGSADLIKFATKHEYQLTTTGKMQTLAKSTGVSLTFPQGPGVIFYTTDLCFWLPTGSLSEITPLTVTDYRSGLKWCAFGVPSQRIGR